MHGTMFVHLRKYTEDRLGPSAWDGVLGAARLGPRVYLPIKSYPDEELVAIVTALSQSTGLAIPDLLDAFGQYVAPHLIAMYRHLLNPAWRTLDVLLNVEATAHRAVRIEQPEASPPYLEARRVGEHEIEIHYTSARRLCHVARGIIRGLAAHFGEPVTIEESACMHRGADRCLIRVSDLA